MIKAHTVVKAPLIKADKTASLKFGTLEEMSLEDIQDFTELAYNDTTVTVIVIPDGEYFDSIQKLAQELVLEESDENEN